MYGLDRDSCGRSYARLKRLQMPDTISNDQDGVSSKLTPALFTRMCSAPKLSTVCCTSLAGKAGSVTSPGTDMAFCPRSVICLVTCVSAVGSTNHWGCLQGERFKAFHRSITWAAFPLSISDTTTEAPW